MLQIKFRPLKEEGMKKNQLRSFAFLLISVALFLPPFGGGYARGGEGGSDSGGSSVDPATPGYTELGCGTDVFEEYASENNVKGRVLNIGALNAQKLLVLNPSVQEGKIQRVSGTSVSEYASELGVTVGLKGSYMWFSASVKTAFTDNTYRMSEYSYVTLMERHCKNSLKIVNTKWDPAYLKSYLTDDAKMASNNTDSQKNWSPKEIISTFGTHVMVGIFTGARLDYNLSIKITNTSQQKNLQAYAEAKANTNHRFLHFETSNVRTPLKALVLGDDWSLNAAQPFEARKIHLWWGPQDLNNDGKVDNDDAQLVLKNVVWIKDQNGEPINLNEGAKSQTPPAKRVA